MVFKEIEENVWKRWRGKVDKKGNKVIGRMAAEDLDKKIHETQKNWSKVDEKEVTENRKEAKDDEQEDRMGRARQMTLEMITKRRIWKDEKAKTMEEYQVRTEEKEAGCVAEFAERGAEDEEAGCLADKEFLPEFQPEAGGLTRAE